MVVNLFILFGMAMVTVIIWVVGEDDMDMVKENMPSYDQNLLSFALTQVFSFVPFIISVAFQWMNFWLITLESRDEMGFYLKRKKRGMKILNGCLAFSGFSLTVIWLLYYGQNAYNEKKAQFESEGVHFDLPPI